MNSVITPQRRGSQATGYISQNGTLQGEPTGYAGAADSSRSPGSYVTGADLTVPPGSYIDCEPPSFPARTQ